MTGWRVRIGVVCSVGAGPYAGGRENNEDNFLVCQDGRMVWRDEARDRVTEVPRGPAVLCAVADGMGGHEDGEIASAAAVQTLGQLYARPASEHSEAALRTFFLEAHRKLHARVAAEGPVRMGTTLAAFWLLDGAAAWTNVGDSRLYVWRAGALERLSRDQTRAEFARRDGRPEPSSPDNLAQNFVYGSRGLGDNAAVRIDAGVDTGTWMLQDGDVLLACSDGLHGWVDDAEIAALLGEHPEPQACANALLARALERDSADNVTVLVLRVDEEGGWDRTLLPA